MIFKITFFLLFLSVVNTTIQAKNVLSGEALIVKGTVTKLPPHTMESSPLKKGQKIAQGTSILTGDKSFTKIKLQGGQILVIAPNSKAIITKLTQKKTNTVGLLKGAIRAAVEKENSTRKHKLFVKTPTAIMGVRGTDFQANFEPKTMKSTLITYEGEVEISKQSPDEKFEQSSIDDYSEYLEENSVKVKMGEIIQVEPQHKLPPKPMILNPRQFVQMQKNEEFIDSSLIPVSDNDVAKATKEIEAIRQEKLHTKQLVSVQNGELKLDATEQEVAVPQANIEVSEKDNPHSYSIGLSIGASTIEAERRVSSASGTLRSDPIPKLELHYAYAYSSDLSLQVDFSYARYGLRDNGAQWSSNSYKLAQMSVGVAQRVTDNYELTAQVGYADYILPTSNSFGRLDLLQIATANTQLGFRYSRSLSTHNEFSLASTIGYLFEKEEEGVKEGYSIKLRPAYSFQYKQSSYETAFCTEMIRQDTRDYIAQNLKYSVSLAYRID